MIPVYQTSDPGTFGPTNNGDCLRACLASLLELPLAEVPHFMEAAERARVWPFALAEWLQGRALDMDVVTPSGDLDDVLAFMGEFHPNDHYILCGQSGEDFGHVVIGKGGEIVHDPSPRVRRGSHALTGPVPTCGKYVAILIHPARSPTLPACAPIDFSPLAQHEPGRIALLLSGGKDSLALWHVCRPYLDRMTVYHCDTGDMVPETADIVREIEARSPRFVRIESDVIGWKARNGIPSHLVPDSCTPIGRAMKHGRGGTVSVVPSWACCSANVWEPKAKRLAADGITLVMQGLRRQDHGWGTMEMLPPVPTDTRRICREEGRMYELWCPLADWTTADVFAYLDSIGQRTGRYYAERSKAPQCARCSAGWDQGRAQYLREFYPELAADYERDMRLLRREIAKPLAELRAEMAALDGTRG